MSRKVIQSFEELVGKTVEGVVETAFGGLVIFLSDNAVARMDVDGCDCGGSDIYLGSYFDPLALWRDEFKPFYDEALVAEWEKEFAQKRAKQEAEMLAHRRAAYEQLKAEFEPTETKPTVPGGDWSEMGA